MAQRCRIVIIEDDEQVSALLDYVISVEGYEVELVRPPLDRCEDIDFGEYDLAIIDLSLPRGLDGFAVAQRAAAAQIGIILMSGNQALYERAMSFGYPFLQKPFRIASLIQCIHDVLQSVATDCERQKAASA
ncbi:MAG TPA: response regulator [Stellaceae bacterium]